MTAISFFVKSRKGIADHPASLRQASGLAKIVRRRHPDPASIVIGIDGFNRFPLERQGGS